MLTQIYVVTGNNELSLFPEARGSPTSEVMSRANGHTISEDYKTWWLFYNANNPTTSPQLAPEAMAGRWVCEVRRTDGRETPLNIVLLLYTCGKKIAAGKGQGQYVRQEEGTGDFRFAVVRSSWGGAADKLWKWRRRRLISV